MYLQSRDVTALHFDCDYMQLLYYWSLMHVLPLLLPIFFLPALSFASEGDQVVMSAGLREPDYTPLITPQPTLADLLTIEPSASIFYSYARELELSSIFSEPCAEVSLFVPTNKAIKIGRASCRERV